MTRGYQLSSKSSNIQLRGKENKLVMLFLQEQLHAQILAYDEKVRQN